MDIFIYLFLIDLHLWLYIYVQIISKYAQILVKVINDQNNMAQVLSIEPVSDNFNMDNYNKTVDLANGKFNSLFV